MSTIPGVCIYILKAIKSVHTVLADIERSRAMISGFKSAFVCKGLKIVTFVCDSEGRHPVAEKCRRSLSTQPADTSRRAEHL